MIRLVCILGVFSFSNCALVSILDTTQGKLKGIPGMGRYFDGKQNEIEFRVIGRSNPMWRDWRFKKQSALGSAYSSLTTERSLWLSWGIDTAKDLHVALDPVEWEHQCNSVIRAAIVEHEVRDPETGHISIELSVTPLQAVRATMPARPTEPWKQWQEAMTEAFRSKIFRKK